MGKPLFQPKYQLNIVDRSKVDSEGNQPILYSALCKDLGDAERLKRIFFRLVNHKLKHTQYGYTIETLTKGMQRKGLKTTRANATIPADQVLNSEDYTLTFTSPEEVDNEIKKLLKVKESLLSDQKKREEEDAQMALIEKLKKNIIDEANKQIAELVNQVRAMPIETVKNLNEKESKKKNNERASA